MTERGIEREMKGKIDQGVGKVKEEVGDLTDDHRLEAEGRAQGLKGEVKEGVGKVQRRLEE